MIKFKVKGNFNNTERFFKNVKSKQYMGIISKYGQLGVDALSSATPVDGGLTSSSWGYEVKVGRSGMSIAWTNSNVNDGVPIAVIIQYGHGTGTGGYVKGIDYINPSIQPIFEKIANDVWKEVVS